MKRLTFLQSLGMVGLYIGVLNMLSTLLLLPSYFLHGKLVLNLTLLAAANAAAIVGTVFLAMLIFRIPWRALVDFGPMPWRVVPAVMVMSLGSFVLCSEVDNITRMFLPMPKVYEEMFQEITNVARNPIGAALALAVVAPLAEELLCRNWVLGSLLRRRKPWRAIGLSAAIFGLMHLNPWQFIYATLLGLSFGWIFWRTGALWLCVLAHALNNGLVWMFVFFQPEIPGLTNVDQAGPQLQPWWMDGGALALFLVGAWWLRTQTVPPQWQDSVLQPAATPGELPPVLPPPLPPGA